ncbi:MAG: hypothetical protein KDA62_12990, partial [Planctomycetales bacterium]|nr:hypothetical protein [Planctomycetales bacterium]
MRAVQLQALFATLIWFTAGSSNVLSAEDATPPTAEQQAIAALRGLTTNIQFNKDGSTRLIRLSKAVVTNEALAHLQHFTQLDYLAIICPQITDENTNSISKLTNLDTLVLTESGVGNATLSHVSELQKLERLYLAGTKISDAGLASLSSLKNLTELSLERTEVSDQGLSHLRELENLELLLLNETQVRGSGLVELAELPKLRVLYLEQCDLTSASLAHLSKIPSLEHLSVNGVSLDATALESLSMLSQLKHLELYGAGCTIERLSALRDSLPNTQLYVDPELAASERIARFGKGAAPVGNPSKTEAITKDSVLLVPITQRLDQTQETPDFQRHVIPLLGRLGCNGRSCHGSFQGQGGFRLSMFGYDFALDHENLLERIDLDSPNESLILNKPTSADLHEGGLRLPPGGWE